MSCEPHKLLFALLLLATSTLGMAACNLPGIIDVNDQDASLEPDASGEECPASPQCLSSDLLLSCVDGEPQLSSCRISEICSNNACEDVTGSCDGTRGLPFRLTRSELVYDVPELLAECDCTGPTGCDCTEVDYKSQQRQLGIENCSSRSIFIQEVSIKDNAVRPDGEFVYALDRSYRDIEIPSGSSRTIDVFYRPAPGVSQLATSDLDITIIGQSADVRTVPLRTRSFCVTATPVRDIYTLIPGQEISFDATVSNCGTETVTLTGAELLNWKGPGEPSVDVPEKLPFQLEAGQSTSARLRMRPEEAGLFEGTVRFGFTEGPVASGALTRVEGAAAPQGCADVDLPKLDVFAAGDIVEEDDFVVEPATFIDFRPRILAANVRPLFSLPTAPDAYLGRVEFDDTAGTLAADVVGNYLVRYRAFDETTGQLSCDYDDISITALSSAPLYVELTWLADGDDVPADEGFGRGADLDLYVLSGGVDDWQDVSTACFPEAELPCGEGQGRRVVSSLTGRRPEAYAFDRVDGVSFRFGAYLRNTYNFEDGVRAHLKVWRDGLLVEDASRTSPAEPGGVPRLRAANAFWLASSWTNGVGVPLGLYQTGVP